MLPKSFTTNPNKRYPVIYEIPGFGGDHFLALYYDDRTRVAGTEMLYVVLDPCCRTGHHVFADSENNGPYARALVEELIPHIEKEFRGLGVPTARFLTGHSSGGHLAGCVLTTDWARDFGLPKDVVKGGLCASGMYDLKPVRLSKRSKYVKFTDEIEEELSAQRHLDRLNCPIIVAHGTLETPEFQRQARDFAAAVKAAGKPIKFLVGESYNHFEMLETLATPYGLLGRAVLEQMKLA